MARDVVEGMKRRWSTEYDRGAHDYTDEGCRVLAEHAFRDIPPLVAVVEAAKKEHALIHPDYTPQKAAGWWQRCSVCAALARLYAGSSGES